MIYVGAGCTAYRFHPKSLKEENSIMARKAITMDGNTAAAHVSYAFTEVAGIYPITVCFEPAYPRTKDSGKPCRVTFSLEVIDAVLPPQELQFTQWFHCDGLARYYHTKAFDDAHFAIIENFVKIYK